MDQAVIELVRRCKENDEDAFNELLSQYDGYLYRICYSFTRSREDSMDMLQEIYLKIFRGLNSFDENRPLLPWLKKIAINTMINNSKKNRIPETSFDSSRNHSEGSSHDGFTPQDYLAADDLTEETVIFNDTRDAIDRLIGDLPAHYRLALTMRYHEEMSYEAIAQALNQPLGTVKNSVFRARNLLRAKMLACELLEV